MAFGAMEAILPTPTAPASLTDAHEAGFDGLELDVAGPDPGDDPLWTPVGRDRIRRRARDLGVDLPSICLGFLNDGGLTADDPDVRADARAAIRRGIDAAAAIGADVVLVPFFADAAIETTSHRERVVAGIDRVAASARAADVTLALETTLSGADDRDLLERIDSPAVGAYYDVGNAITYGHDPVEDVLALGEHVVRVHFKDREAGEGHRIGEGAVDFEACVDALEDVGYDDWIVLETASPDDPLADAATNLERARRLLE